MLFVVLSNKCNSRSFAFYSLSYLFVDNQSSVSVITLFLITLQRSKLVRTFRYLDLKEFELLYCHNKLILHPNSVLWLFDRYLQRYNDWLLLQHLMPIPCSIKTLIINSNAKIPHVVLDHGWKDLDLGIKRCTLLVSFFPSNPFLSKTNILNQVIQKKNIANGLFEYSVFWTDIIRQKGLQLVYSQYSPSLCCICCMSVWE